jgi:ubiquinol-cytochrome c reductase iron-sulfur subunit
VTDGNRKQGGARLIGFAFVVSSLASIGLTIVYALGGQPQLEGALLGIALGGVAFGLAMWAHKLLPGGPFAEPRATVPYQTAARPQAEASFEVGAGELGRRGFLLKLLGGALGALGLASIFPIRSLGERPGQALFRTHWGPGVRAVTSAGTPISVTDIDIGGVLTVFPEGQTEAADSQTLLIRLAPGEYRAPPGREDWAPEGFVAFSKICPHAGCPVGLYQPDTKELFCPCHQSVFDVDDAARPSGGPATRPLPQLPLAIDDAGYVVAQRDFSEPVGPGFWSRSR